MGLSKIRRALGAARLKLLYPGYVRSYIAQRCDEEACLLSTYSAAKITSAEKEEIESLWGRIIPGPLKRSDIFYRMIKSIDQFDARYVPSSFYYPYILFALSPEKYALYLDNKSLMPTLFPEIAQPEHLCCTIGGLLQFCNETDDDKRIMLYN